MTIRDSPDRMAGDQIAKQRLPPIDPRPSGLGYYGSNLREPNPES
jgi:hypothetical protein